MAFQEMLYQISVYCMSDIGLIRHNNEDAWKLLKDVHFFALADGMGGHKAGEVASKETVNRLCDLFQEHHCASYDHIEDVKQELKIIIKEVNAFIYRLGRENSALRGMGTTLCCVYVHREGLVYGHVGDSRIYRFREGKLQQLTQDHSLLRELIDLGQLSEQQADEFLYKNIITKAVGTEPCVEADVAYTPLESNDLILMCTDGLSDLISLEEMQEIMTQTPEEEISALLIKKAKQKGGHDNITVILVKIREKDESYLPGL